LLELTQAVLQADPRLCHLIILISGGVLRHRLRLIQKSKDTLANCLVPNDFNDQFFPVGFVVISEESVI